MPATVGKHFVTYVPEELSGAFHALTWTEGSYGLGTHVQLYFPVSSTVSDAARFSLLLLEPALWFWS